MHCFKSDKLRRAVRMSRRCKRFTKYNWAPRSASLYCKTDI